MQIYTEKQVKAINLLQVGSESKLLSVLDEDNLSDSELDEIPLWINKKIY